MICSICSLLVDRFDHLIGQNHHQVSCGKSCLQGWSFWIHSNSFSTVSWISVNHLHSHFHWKVFSWQSIEMMNDIQDVNHLKEFCLLCAAEVWLMSEIVKFSKSAVSLKVVMQLFWASFLWCQKNKVLQCFGLRCCFAFACSLIQQWEKHDQK